MARTNSRTLRRLDRSARALLLASVLAALAGCAPSCVVYQRQEQHTAAPCTPAP